MPEQLSLIRTADILFKDGTNREIKFTDLSFGPHMPVMIFTEVGGSEVLVNPLEIVTMDLTSPVTALVA